MIAPRFDLPREEPEAAAALPRGLVRWRRALLAALLVVLAAELVWPIATWPAALVPAAFYLYRLGWLAVLVLLAAFWAALFRFARAAGGTTYALGYLGLSVALTPLAVGVVLLPEMVLRDVAGGQAERRRRRSLPLRERALRTGLYLAALAALGLPLYALEPRLALAAPVLALFLQRLVLPWLPGPGPADGPERR